MGDTGSEVSDISDNMGYYPTSSLTMLPKDLDELQRHIAAVMYLKMNTYTYELLLIIENYK